MATGSYTILPYIDPALGGNDIMNQVSNICNVDNNFAVSQSMTGIENAGAIQTQNLGVSGTCLFSDVATFSQTIVGSISGNAASATTAATATTATTSTTATTATTATTSSNIALTSDNTPGSYYIPFSKTTSTSSNTLYIDPTVSPLTYNPAGGNLNVLSITPNVVQTTVQILASGSPINYLFGSIIVDVGATNSSYTLPILAGINNGITIHIQKTSSTNHNCVITAGTGNQIASTNSNALNNTFTMTSAIFQISFRFINPNWFPF